MRRLVWVLLLCSCASRGDSPDLRAIRAGETPRHLETLTDSATLEAIAQEVVKGSPVSEAVKLHLCAHATRGQVQALFVLLEKGSPKTAYAALFALVPVMDATLLPRVETMLEASSREARLRGLMLVGETGLPAAAAVLARRNLLTPDDRELSRVALQAMAACRDRASHDAILDYYEKTDEEAALVALSRIWEMQKETAPLARSDEIRRLSVQRVLFRRAMGGESNAALCGSMLRIMTPEELEKFISLFAGERFPSRRLLVHAAGAEGFDLTKGRRLHAAFLASPDPRLLGRLLYFSPHELPVEGVTPLLANEQIVEDEEIPGEIRVCDLASWRLAAQVERKVHPLPLPDGELTRWREWAKTK